jgi:hypothetical protein
VSLPLRIWIVVSAASFVVSSPIAYGAPVEPTTRQTTTQPFLAETPRAAMTRLLRALDTGNREAVLSCWDTGDEKEAKIAALQADMMLAVAKLKKSVRSKMGEAAPFDLEMAVVGQDECGPIKEQISGDRATVDVASIDEQQPHRTYVMVRIDRDWKLSTADQLNRPAKGLSDSEVAAGRAMIRTIDAATAAVASGQLKTTDDVKRKISESMGGP